MKERVLSFTTLIQEKGSFLRSFFVFQAFLQIRDSRHIPSAGPLGLKHTSLISPRILSEEAEEPEQVQEAEQKQGVRSRTVYTVQVVIHFLFKGGWGWQSRNYLEDADGRLYPFLKEIKPPY